MPFAPSAPSLRSRLDARTWSADWPVMDAEPALDWSRLTPSGWWEGWSETLATARALENEGTVSLGAAHDFLDRLEGWTQKYRHQLTWPPTSQGFAQALVVSLAARDTQVLAVLTHRPAACLAVLESHPDIAAQIPEHSRSLLAAMRQVAAPPSPVVEAPAPAPAPASAPAPRVRAEPTPPAPHLVFWLKELVQELRDHHGNAAVKSARIDEAFKQLRRTERADAHKGWFEETLLPALAQQDAASLKVLLDSWPSHHHFAVGDPVSFVGTPRLWAILRDAPAPDLLLSQALPQWVDSTPWSFEQRYAMLEPMFKLVSNNEKKFRQRLSLWEGWGGNLDQEEILAAAPGADAFTAASEPVSARAWFLGQENAMWKSVMEASSAPTSSVRPRVRP